MMVYITLSSGDIRPLSGRTKRGRE